MEQLCGEGAAGGAKLECNFGNLLPKCGSAVNGEVSAAQAGI